MAHDLFAENGFTGPVSPVSRKLSIVFVDSSGPPLVVDSGAGAVPPFVGSDAGALPPPPFSARENLRRL